MSGDYGCNATLADGLVVCFSNNVGGGYCYYKEVGTGFTGYTFNCEEYYCPYSGFDVGQDQTAYVMSSQRYMAEPE
jgi:hypothetical protein